MSKESDCSDRGWHMLVAPFSSEKSLDQQDLLDEDFCKSLPRAHFLHPGCFPAAAERETFSPDTHDLCFKDDVLQDLCSWDSKSSASVAHSSSPHPLAQPGFYSPKIPLSRRCKPATEFHMSKNTKEYHAHTLPHTKFAVFKQRTLSCRPQGIQTLVVEKPQMMRAAISPTLPHSAPINPIQQQTNDHKFHQDQEIQATSFSSLHQLTLNSTSTEICKKQDHLWSHCEQAQSTTKRNLLSVNKKVKDEHKSKKTFTGYPSLDHLNLQKTSNFTGYSKLSVYNGTCYSSNTPGDGSNSSRQLRGKGTQSCNQQGETQESNTAGNDLIHKRNNRQVDTKSKNVFGQACVIATLRSGYTPQPVHKTTVVEDLKKLILMGEPDLPTQTSCATESLRGSLSPKPVMLYSSVCTKHSVANPKDLFLQSDPSMFQPQSGLSDTQMCYQDNRFKQNPLNLDWNCLVNAAETHETHEMADLLANESSEMQSGANPEPHSQHHDLSKASDDDVFIDDPDHLEAMLMRLSTDLLKEKKDKVALLAEVLKLRMSNQHLKEESLSANAQLHKICQMFNINPEYMG